MRVIAAARLHLRAACRRPATTIAAVVSVTVVVALATTIWFVTDSLTTSVSTVASLTGRATFEVSSNAVGAVLPDDVDAIAAQPGVAAAAPVVRTVVEMSGLHVAVLGVDARAQALGGALDTSETTRLAAFSEHPSRLLDGVFVGPRLAAHLHLRAGLRTRFTPTAPELTVLGVADDPTLSRVDGGTFVLALLPVAEQLAGHPGRADAVLVATAPSADLSAVAGHLELASGQQLLVSSPRFREADAVSYVTEVRRASLALVVMAVVGGAVVVALATSLVAAHRRDQLALLARLGAPPRAVGGAVMAHAAAIGASGSLLGVVSGAVIAHHIVARLQPLPVATLQVAYAVHYDAAVAVVALLGGTGVAVAASVGSRRRAQAVPVARRSSWLGRAHVVPSVLRRWGGPAGAVLSEARVRRPARWIVAGTAATIGMAAGLGAVAADLGRVAKSTTTSWRSAPVVVQTSSLGEPPIGAALPTDLVQRIAAMPGVTGVVADHLAYVSDGRHDYRVEALGRGSSAPILALAPPGARTAVEDGSGVVVSRLLAQRAALHRGSLFELRSADGAHALPVVAVVDLPEPAVAVSADRFGSRVVGADRLEVHTTTPVAAAAVVAAAHDRGVVAGTGAALATASARPLVGVSHALALIAALAVAVAAGGLVLGALLDALGRRRELERLSRLGASRRDLWRVRVVEQIGALAAGALMGGLVGLAASRAAEAGLARVSALPLGSGMFPGFGAGLVAAVLAALPAGAALIVVAAGSADAAALPKRDRQKERPHGASTVHRLVVPRRTRRRVGGAGVQRR